MVPHACPTLKQVNQFFKYYPAVSRWLSLEGEHFQGIGSSQASVGNSHEKDASVSCQELNSEPLGDEGNSARTTTVSTLCKISILSSVYDRGIPGPTVDMLNLCVKRIIKNRGQGSTKRLQLINFLDFVGQMVFVATTQYFCYSIKTAIDNI